ncbi:phage minor head protein [uncultured Sphaerotilus sp.]|uniref:phage head morphogenesis protein n=1 Tax=uncultured Sphaerotilus sp. TaxID=474984 RepID=UPI0030CA3B05
MTTAPADIKAGIAFKTPFDEQLEFFRAKLNLPTDRWDDIMRSAHDRAFIVAGAAKADLLQDLRQAVDGVIGNGHSIGRFRKDFQAIAARHGWTGWTGEGSKAGEAWRTRVIYQTNLQTSYAAGRWRQLNDPAVLAGLPYWEYVHRDGVLHPRPQHLAWNGLTLRHDDAFWRTHYPPNGWGCHCRVRARVKPRAGNSTERPDGWDALDPKTQAPRGIDKGFDYQPGASAAAPLQGLIDQKLIKLDAPIGAAMGRHLEPAVRMERQQAWWNTLDDWRGTPQRGRVAVVGAIAPEHLDWLMREKKIAPQSAAVGIREGLVRGTKQDRHMSAQDGLADSDWRRLPEIIAQPEAVYYDERTGKLVYVVSSGDDAQTKLSLEFDYRVGKERLNMIVSGFRQAEFKIAEMVKGGLYVPLPEVWR